MLLVCLFIYFFEERPLLATLSLAWPFCLVKSSLQSLKTREVDLWKVCGNGLTVTDLLVIDFQSQRVCH